MRKHAGVCMALGLTAVVVAGCSSSGQSVRRAGATTSTSVTTRTSPRGTAPSTTATSAQSGPLVVVAGNGVASVQFGQSQFAATGGLDQALGSPVKGPIDMAGNCDVDAAEQWSTMTAYFYQGSFVGYGTWAANGEAVPRGNFETVAGLRVGDTITQAETLYGSAFQTSAAQGGSWSVSTPEGRVIGYLSGVPGQPGPTPTISSVAAGSVGCPAATP